MLDRTRGRFCLKFGSWLWGVEHSLIRLTGAPYLERWILYLGRGGIRVHKFYRGDDDTAPHDHPFWFITIPLRGYWERVYNKANKHGTWLPKWRYVRPFLPAFRRPSYKHIVHGPTPLSWEQPVFWTLVIFGFASPNWGFWPTAHKFIPWEEFNDRGGKESYAATN